MDKNNFLINTVKKNGAVYAGLSTIGGFIGDVLQPLAPFSEYIFYISSVISLLLLLTYFIIGGIREKIASLLILSITIFIVSGSIFGLQSVTKSKDGVLSDTIPAIKSLQSSLNIIEQGITDIKSDTTEIKKTTNDISTKIDILGEKVGKQGGIISNPNTPEEYYSNARHYELKGDFINARKAYLKYFTYKKDYIDPHLRFFKLLKIQEGRAGAREIYSDLRDMYPSIPVDVIYALSLNSEKKIKQLKELILMNPSYSPIQYFLSQEYSLDKLGEQSLGEKKLEKEHLEKFLEMVKDGTYLKYYMDKNIATKQVDDAQIRLNAIKSLDTSMPIDLRVAITPTDLHFDITIAEPTSEISYSFEKNANYKITGNTDKNQGNGRLSSREHPIAPLPQDTKEKFKFFVKYKDIKGQENGPFDLSFYLWDAYRAQGKRLLTNGGSMMRISKKFIDFSTVLFYRECVNKIMYGIDKKIPDTEFGFTKCTAIGKCSSGDKTGVTLKTAPKYISIQIEFYDKTKSDIMVIKP